MAKQITADEVAQAEADFVKSKKTLKDPDKRRQAMEDLAALRSAFRAQEEAAGRRGVGNGPGGDAVKES